VPQRNVRSIDDVLTLLDGLFAPDAGRDRWDRFYGDRDRDVPFFAAKPDENLVTHLGGALRTPGRALDLGSGPGRNALHLAAAGWTVDAVDLSPTAVAWGRERAAAAGVEVAFRCADAFAADLTGPYDLVYDSGCLHHLPPHRRVGYLALLDRCLAPGGHLGLACFAAGAMGSDLPDADLYRHGRLDGGLAFTPEDLRWIFAGYTEVDLRRMRDEPGDSKNFGEAFLWTALFLKDR
jgi:SAM-dependent methyltransferase